MLGEADAAREAVVRTAVDAALVAAAERSDIAADRVVSRTKSIYLGRRPYAASTACHCPTA